MADYRVHSIIWLNIFRFSDSYTLARCRSVCKTWNNMILSLPLYMPDHLLNWSKNEDEFDSLCIGYGNWLTIFQNLPPETLALCRCVCRTWYSLILCLPPNAAYKLPNCSRTEDKDDSLLLRLNTNDDDSEVEEYIQFLREKLPPKVVEGSAHKEYEKLLRLEGLEPAQRYVDGMSLLEIFSVRIHPSAPGTTCEIYGEIQVRDELGNMMTLYDRSEEEAELVSNLGVLSLDMSICPARPLTIYVNLTDKIQRGYIAKGMLRLFYHKKEDFDEELQYEEVCGVCGYASISYRSFRSAVVAEISVVYSCDLDVCKRAMYGTVRARLGALNRNYGHFKDKIDDQILVHNKQDVPLSLSNEGIIKLSKSMVVVPACSSLRVGMRLNACEDMSLIAYGNLVFDAKDDEHVRRELLGENDECVIAVNIKWSLGDDIFPRMKVFNKEIMGKHDIAIIEIFSFSIGCSNENIRLLGKIQVCSDIDNFNIFEGNGNFAMDACVSWPKRPVLAVGDLRIKLNLRDSQGRQICKGYVLPFEFASQRICSVVRGEYGCAAIHYAIIKDAMVATIIVKFFPDDRSLILNVNGRISTRYGDSEYKTYYDKTYYESVLFNRSIENMVSLSYGGEIPFVKYVVAVPKNSSLIVKFDLVAWKARNPELCTSPDLFLQERARFKPFKGDHEKIVRHKKIVGCGFYVTVEVSWESNIQAVSRMN